MRLSKILAAVGLLTVAIIAFTAAAPVDAVAGPIAAHVSHGFHGFDLSSLVYQASPVLLALRGDHVELVRRAAAKLAEVKDGLTPDQVRQIETDHAELVRQAEAKKVEITAEETRIAAEPKADPVAIERARAAEITTLVMRHGLPDKFATDHIGLGTPLSEVRTLVLDEVAKRADQIRINPRAAIIRDEGDTRMEAVETAILHRANPASVKIAGDAPARAWQGMSLLEMGRAYHEETTGQRLRGLGKIDLASRILGLDNGLRGGGQLATSDFPSILANVVSKRLRNAYESAPQHWKLLGRQSNAPDFKSRAVVQLSNLPQFKKVREGAEFQYAGLSDGQEVYALATYGRIVAITRQTLINDDMHAFDRLPTLLGRAAAETEASIFWQIFVANANMNDGVPLFHASHGNLGTAGAINGTTLDEGRKSMRKQKGLGPKGTADAEPLNLVPKYLVASPDKETEAQTFLATQLYPSAPNQVNVFAGSLQLIVEARLTGNAWYLSADPAAVDTIEYAWLEGEEGLFTEQRLGFEVDGLEVKGRIDFAAKAIDWRGVFKNAGN